MRRTGWLLALLGLVSPPGAAEGAARPPNVVLILADDLGYGDVACYNPDRGKIPTPHLDRLAREGMRFTDAHSTSGVCSPTRYSILTGRYHWRTRLQAGIVGVWGKPLIAPDRPTIATLARRLGHHTSCVGKWHLGWDWPIAEGQMRHFRGLGGKPGGGGKVTTAATPEQVAAWKEVFSRPIPGGPTARGFDEYFGTDVPNWPPYCFVENDRTVGTPSALLPAPALARNQASLQGPALPDWKLDAVLPALTDRACAVIARQARAGKPFLLYLPLTSPHTPLAVAPEWRGKGGLGHPYADLVVQTDAAVGRVLAALKAAGVADDTLVLFTSDNGCAPYIGAAELEAKGHHPSGPFRGYKADAWEGGHRVPLVARWPGVVPPGSVCTRTVSSVDFFATLADALGAKVPPGAGEDSVSLLPLLRGGDRPAHEAVVHHSAQGVFAVRAGRWKAILGPGSGAADGTGPRLYDLEADPGERKDLAADNPGEVARLTRVLEGYIARGRSTPGPDGTNDVPVQAVKRPKKGAPAEKPPAPKEAAPGVVARDVAYLEAGGEKLHLHVFAPADLRPADLRPGEGRTAIVFFFGGGWASWNPTQFAPFARHFAGQGCVAVCADYRVASRHRTTPADAVRDARAAVRYVREHARELGVAPDRIVVAGGSAGGHLAACTTLLPGTFDPPGTKEAAASANALVLFNPVLDTSASGFGGAKRGDELKPLSPLHHVRPGLPPTLILHGTGDSTVPYAQAEAFARAMKGAKNVCELEGFEGRPHGFFNSPEFRKGRAGDYQACLDRVTRFLTAQKLLPARKEAAP